MFRCLGIFEMFLGAIPPSPTWFAPLLGLQIAPHNPFRAENSSTIPVRSPRRRTPRPPASHAPHVRRNSSISPPPPPFPRRKTRTPPRTARVVAPDANPNPGRNHSTTLAGSAAHVPAPTAEPLPPSPPVAIPSTRC